MNKKILLFLSILYSMASNAQETVVGSGLTHMSASNLTQISYSLAVILVLIFLVYYLVKKMSLGPKGLGGVLKIVSAVSVGSKEKLVVVNFQDNLLVLGVTQANIRLLDKSDKPITEQVVSYNAESFVDLLKKSIKKGKGL